MVRVAPESDGVGRALKAWAAQSQGWIDGVQRSGPLLEERAVRLRAEALSVRLLTHLHERDGVPPAAQIANLRGGVLRYSVEQRHRNDRPETASQPAGVDGVQAGLLAVQVDVEGTVPGIGR